MILFPRLTKVVPAPLVSIVILTAVTVGAGIAVPPTVGDKGKPPSSLPVPGLPDVPFTWHTLTVIAPYAPAVSLVGLMETLMTAKLVDDITDSPSNKTRESIGQGIADIVTGFVRGHGRLRRDRPDGDQREERRPHPPVHLPRRLLPADPLRRARADRLQDVHGRPRRRHGPRLNRHLRLALRQPASLKRMPPGETTVMVITALCVVATGDLAIGVVAGSLTAMVIFARRVAHVANVTGVVDPDGRQAVYAVTGELFFASANDIVHQGELGDHRGGTF